MNQSVYSALDRFLPAGTSGFFPDLLDGYAVLIKITPARSTKYGDYRPLKNKKYRHQITINNDLNPYAFLVTFLHEIAHMYAFEIHGYKVKPHGTEWKEIYTKILIPFISREYLPRDVYESLLEHINGPTASSCSDQNLFQALKKYNPENNHITLLESLPTGALFKWRDGTIFKKTTRLRKRYKCIDIKTQRIWYFHPMAEIEEIES